MATLTYLQVIAAIRQRLNRESAGDDLEWNQVARDFSADRVNYYKKLLFYEGQVEDTSINTGIGTKFYNFPTGWENVNSIWINNGGVWLLLGRRTHSDILNFDSLEPSVRSLPALWAPLAAQFRLFPVPSAVQNLKLVMDIPSDVPADGSSNFWTDDAQSLTINASCAEISSAAYLNDPVREARFRALETRERIALISKTIRIGGGIRTVSYL